MTVVGLWGVDFYDRSGVEENFLIFSTRRVSGAWPMLLLPLQQSVFHCLARRQHDLWRLHTVTEHRDPCGVRGAWTVVHFSRGGPRASKPARVDDCGRNARHVPKPKVWGYSIRE